MAPIEHKPNTPVAPTLPTNSEEDHAYDVKETSAWWVIKFIMWKMPKTKGGKKKLDKNGKEIGVIPSAVMRDEYEQFKKRFPEADFKEWAQQKFVDVVEEKIIEHLGLQNKNGSWQPNLKEAEQYVRDMCKLVIANITKTEPAPEVKERLKKTGTPSKDYPETPTPPATPPSPTPNGGSGNPSFPDSDKTPKTPDPAGEKPGSEPTTPEVVPPVVDPEKTPSPSVPQPEKTKDTRKPETDKQKFKTKPEFSSPRISVNEVFGNMWQGMRDIAYEAFFALVRIAEGIMNMTRRSLEYFISIVHSILSFLDDVLPQGSPPGRRDHENKHRWWATGCLMTVLTALLFWATGNWILVATGILLTLYASVYDYINETD